MWGVFHDRSFDQFEEYLDWLEVIGVQIERIDPREVGRLAKHPTRKRYSLRMATHVCRCS